MSAARATNNISSPPTHRVVLLGASNLAKGFGTVLQTVNCIWGEHVEVHAALGLGRSYGRTTRVMGCGLPGIAACGLWPNLTSDHDLPTSALLTDIGNDLLYEEPVERIVGWLETCLDRLAATKARVTITRLPVANLTRLSPLQYLVARRILYPLSGISFSEVTRRAIELDETIARLAAERGLAMVSHQPHWYSFDPVHIRFTKRGEAWRDILGAWIESREAFAPCGSALLRTLHLRTRTPHERRLLFIAQRGVQPAARYRSGTTVSIY